MRPVTPAVYHGTGAAVALSTILGVTQCKWWKVQPISSGAHFGRVGDASAAIDAGIPIGLGIASGAELGFASDPIALAMDFYDLTKWFLFLGNGETASVGCAV